MWSPCARRSPGCAGRSAPWSPPTRTAWPTGSCWRCPMGEPKTKRTAADVTAFLESVADPKRRADARAACELMAEATGAEPAMWGSGIVGFGAYHYRYATGREGDW